MARSTIARVKGRCKDTGRAGLLPALPRQAWVVLAGDFVSAIGSGSTLPFLFIYAHRVRGLSDGTAGLIVAGIGLAALIGNPLGGALADRWTHRRALMAGLALAAAGSAAVAVAHSAIALFASVSVLGLGLAVTWPALNALLASLVEETDCSAVFSVRHASLNAGLGLGALCAAAVVNVAHPGTFTIVYLADSVSFLAFIPVIARLAPPPRIADQPAGPDVLPPAHEQQRTGFRDVARDKAFVRVWITTAVIVTISFGQFQSSFPGYATRPGGIDARGLSVAFAANMLTVVVAQLFVLRWLNGRRRTTGAALAAAAWAVSWATVIAGGYLGGGAGAETVFAAAGVIFALGETLLSPTLPAIMNDLAPAGAAGRYNGLGVLAFTMGFLLGPAIGGVLLGAGWGTGQFVALAAACLAACASALRLNRWLPPAANLIAASTASDADSSPALADTQERAGTAGR